MNLKITDFKIPEELDTYTEALRRFAREVLDPLADKIDKENRPDLDEIRPLIREAGLVALPCPREYGGMGLLPSQWWPLLEIVAGVGGHFRMTTHEGTGLMWRMVYVHGTEEQKKKYLVPWIKGEKRAVFALTEPGTGTGVDIRTTATKQGNNFVLNGQKHLITPFGPIASPADFAYVPAYSKDRSLVGKGISMFIVDFETPGFSWAPMPDLMGLHGWPHLVLNFKDCVVPVESLLGEEGQGLDIALKTGLAPSRWSIAISCLGLAQRLFELAVEYSKMRVTFGKTISSRQGVREMIADMGTNIHALRLMVADVGLKMDRGIIPVKETSMCKAFGIKVSQQVSDAALEIFGGIGVSRAHPVERLYREARCLWFEEGTPSVQRLVISREILNG